MIVPSASFCVVCSFDTFVFDSGTGELFVDDTKELFFLSESGTS